MFDPVQLVRRGVREMPPYEPILPFEVLSRQLGLPVDQIIKLDANENPYGPLPVVAEALAELPYAHIYPDPESRLLRQALAAYHRLPFENLLAGAGADELIDLVMRLFVEPGDTIISCPPTFGMYRFDADINGGRAIQVWRETDFSINVAAIKEAVARHRPKLLFIATPNNPNGSLLRADQLAELLTLPLVVVLDEAYIEFASPGSSFMRQVLAHENLIVLRTFSKWAGLAGLRVGYGLFPDRLMPHLWKMKQPYNVSVAASTAAIVSLEQVAELIRIGHKIVTERDRLFAALQTIPWLEPYPSQANFILCRVLGRDAGQLKADLARRGILLRYFNKPRLADHIRVSVGRPEQTDSLLVALQQLGEEAR